VFKYGGRVSGFEMREILYKNLTGSDNRKRDFSIREIVIRDGVTATIERRCIYFVKETVYLDSPQDLEKLKKLKSVEEVSDNKAHFHIIRKFDAETKEDRLICKVCGRFYVISGHNVYSIAFVNSFKIRLEVDLSIKHV